VQNRGQINITFTNYKCLTSNKQVAQFLGWSENSVSPLTVSIKVKGYNRGSPLTWKEGACPYCEHGKLCVGDQQNWVIKHRTMNSRVTW